MPRVSERSERTRGLGDTIDGSPEQNRENNRPGFPAFFVLEERSMAVEAGESGVVTCTDEG